MRFQLVAGLALLQLHSFAAATTAQGAGAAVGVSGHHGTSSHSSQAKKPHGNHAASMSGSKKGGASMNKGSNKKSKGLPRMDTFSGVHLSPVEGGVVSTIPIMPDLATEQKRAMSSAVASPDSDLPLDDDCSDLFTMGNLPKRCYGLGVPTVPDPIPADCEKTHTCFAIARSITSGVSETTESKPIPSGLFKGQLDCPIVDRRGDFLVRKCTTDPMTTDPINDYPWSETTLEPLEAGIDKKRTPTANEVWTR